MKYYFAPMEGITGYLYRNAHHKYFPGIHKYFTPFLAPNQHKAFGSREKNDILPEHNQDIYIVPQILTNKWEDFVRAAEKLQEMGYEEVNLNLGCPSRTVVSKNKGSGFLAMPEELDHFLEEIFRRLDMKISLKTRLGKEDPLEFDRLLTIFNRYPLEELIIHPRIQQDYYKNMPNLEVFGKGLAASVNPVCYNGDIFSTRDFKNRIELFPDIDRIMLGRGLLTDPALAMELEHGEKPNKETYRKFQEEIYQGYRKVLSGDRNVLFKMKEFWSYMIQNFTDNKKYAKKIRKAERLSVYEETVEALFEEQDIQG